jgi:hypothetical protein
MRLTPSNRHLGEVVKTGRLTPYTWMTCIQNSLNPHIEFCNFILAEYFGVRHGLSNAFAKNSVIFAEIVTPVSKGFIAQSAHCADQFTLHGLCLTFWGD